MTEAVDHTASARPVVTANLFPAAAESAPSEAELAVCFDRAAPAMCSFRDVAPSAGAVVLIMQGGEARRHVHGKVAALHIIASGGFATGARLIAARALGAQGIRCGTALLASKESFAHDDHKARLIAWEEGRPLQKCSTDSPPRTTTGPLEPMAAFAGQGVTLSQAEASLARLTTLAQPGAAS